MYNDLINYFENKCCISNIFMREHWKSFWITIMVLIITIIVYFNVSLKYVRLVLLISIWAILIIAIFMRYLKVLNDEYKKEFPENSLHFGMIEALQCYRENTAIYEMQMNRMKRYCKKENFTNDQIQNFIQYLNEDLEKKYPKDRGNEMFFTLVIPATVSVVTTYITNNQIKNIWEILTVTVASIFYAWIVSFSFHQLLGVRRLFVNKRNNLIELKDVLRNIDMDKLKEEKKIIING